MNTHARSRRLFHVPMAAALAALSVTFTALPVPAATPADEKAFVDAYKRAYEAKDAKGLAALLYTKGADPKALEFYRMMMTDGMGAKIASIELKALDADDRKRASAAMPGPDGKTLKLTLAPVKKLVIKRASKDASGSSSSTSQVFVAESGGKLVIPVPGP